METVSAILLLLAAVIASSALSRALPLPVPLPLLQIVLGAAMDLLLPLQTRLGPDVFLPPLLFLDGWRLPGEALRRDMAVVAHLAVGLVFLTVLGVGVFIRWIIPAMPLAVAFALAAVTSPTDPSPCPPSPRGWPSRSASCTSCRARGC